MPRLLDIDMTICEHCARPISRTWAGGAWFHLPNEEHPTTSRQCAPMPARPRPTPTEASPASFSTCLHCGEGIWRMTRSEKEVEADVPEWFHLHSRWAVCSIEPGRLLGTNPETRATPTPITTADRPAHGGYPDGGTPEWVTDPDWPALPTMTQQILRAFALPGRFGKGSFGLQAEMEAERTDWLRKRVDWVRDNLLSKIVTEGTHPSSTAITEQEGDPANVDARGSQPHPHQIHGLGLLPDPETRFDPDWLTNHGIGHHRLMAAAELGLIDHGSIRAKGEPIKGYTVKPPTLTVRPPAETMIEPGSRWRHDESNVRATVLAGYAENGLVDLQVEPSGATTFVRSLPDPFPEGWTREEDIPNEDVADSMQWAIDAVRSTTKVSDIMCEHCGRFIYRPVLESEWVHVNNDEKWCGPAKDDLRQAMPHRMTYMTAPKEWFAGEVEEPQLQHNSNSDKMADVPDDDMLSPNQTSDEAATEWTGVDQEQPWPPVCIRCRGPLAKPGAIINTPPQPATSYEEALRQPVEKLHVCDTCWPYVEAFLDDLMATVRDDGPRELRG